MYSWNQNNKTYILSILIICSWLTFSTNKDLQSFIKWMRKVLPTLNSRLNDLIFVHIAWYDFLCRGDVYVTVMWLKYEKHIDVAIYKNMQ